MYLDSTPGTAGARLTRAVRSMMLERFTDQARRVVALAQEEARMLNHSRVGTEHILLGLLVEGDGVAAEVLESLGIGLGLTPQAHPPRLNHPEPQSQRPQPR